MLVEKRWVFRADMYFTRPPSKISWFKVSTYSNDFRQAEYYLLGQWRANNDSDFVKENGIINGFGSMTKFHSDWSIMVQNCTEFVFHLGKKD